MPWVLHMRMRANALRCRFLGYLQLDGEGEGLCLGAASLLMVPVFSCCHTHLHWWDSGARRLVPNPRSRLPTSRPVWFCTSYPLAGKLGVLGLYEPSGVIANRLNDLATFGLAALGTASSFAAGHLGAFLADPHDCLVRFCFATSQAVVALLTFSLTMEFSDQSDTWVDVAALLRTYLLIWDTSSSPC